MDAWRLDGAETTLLFGCDGGVPWLLHHGEALPRTSSPSELSASLVRPLGNATLDVSTPVSLHPEDAQGFPGHPALIGSRNGADWAGRFSILDVDATERALAFSLTDAARGLALTIGVSLDPQTDVVTATTALTNTGDAPFDISWLAAPVLGASQDLSETITLTGRWCAEFARTRTPIAPGVTVQDNRRGRTGHASFPGLVLTTPSTTENAGASLGLTLGWSGNHRLLVERLPTGDVQVQAGVLLLPGEAQLAPGETVETPPLYLSYATGLSRLSQNFHAHARRHLISFPTPRPRPVTLNTWEAIYFDHDRARLSALVRAGAEIGAERFVLDDGWFVGRNDDTTSLGDWSVDPVKYPDGLASLADEVRAAGMEFGLWVEPEMVNPVSQVFRDHPDWVLGDARLTGRQQCLLDMSRPEVTAYLEQRIAAVVEQSGATYLKWDMNRDYAAPSGHDDKAAAAAQVPALYALLERLRDRFPDLEIESCASGGGRVDFGILNHCQRFWTSDSNDALERIDIQRGFSMFLPPEVMGAHVGPARSHTSGRGVSMEFRCLVAGWGHFGVEADLTDLSDEEREVLRDAVRRYKADRNLWHGGRLYRIDTPDPALTAVMTVDDTRSAARLVLTQTTRPRSSIPPRLKLAGLEGDMLYRVTLQLATAEIAKANRRINMPLLTGGLTLTGLTLQRLGLALPCLYAQSGLAIAIDAVETTKKG